MRLGTLHILPFLILLFGVVSYAEVVYPDDEWKGFDAHMAERLHKIRELIGREQVCAVAIYGSLVDDFILNRSEFVPEALEAYSPKVVDCVTDISIDAKTINEKTGCALVSYNATTGSYSSYFNRSFKTAMSKKLCNSGGFDELMQMKGWWSADAWENSTVEQTMFTPRREKWQTVLVYVSEAKYVQWFGEARKRGEAFVESKTKKTKSKGKKPKS